jgi:hypothetical protein
MRKIFIFAVVLLVAGCGQKQPPQVRKRAESAQVVPAFPETPPGERVGHAAPAAPPLTEGMHGFGAENHPEPPSYLPLYPGARVKGGFVRGGRIRGGNLIYETDAQPADVIAFYERTTTEAGFVQTMNSASGLTITFGAAAGRRTVQVTVEPITGGSYVRIFWAGIE